MAQTRRTAGHGPFQADQLRDGDRYELSDGHPIYCAPAGSRHAGSNVTGGLLLDTDPDVGWSGIDAGVSAEPGMLRAPDVAVRAAPPEGGGTWLTEAPPLAVEYAAQGQDEADLKHKIAELLQAGTRWIWVVRLEGLPRVEVHAAGVPMRIRTENDLLEAPGVLRNPVPVRALFDRVTAHELVLRNLLQRHGYGSLEEIRQQGEARLLVRQLRQRFGEPPAWVMECLGAATPEQLEQWGERLLNAQTLADVFGSTCP